MDVLCDNRIVLILGCMGFDILADFHGHVNLKVTLVRMTW